MVDKPQNFADCDKLVHLLSFAVKYYLEMQEVGKWNSKDFPRKWQKICRHKNMKAELQDGSGVQTAVQTTES